MTTDTRTWMGKLPEKTTLNNIMMPGSHDAGMSELHHCSIGAGHSNTQTQQMDIYGQLEAGSRYFDIRIDYDHGELVTYHRTGPFGCNGQSIAAILRQAISFLQRYQTEVVILKVSHIRDNKKDTKARLKNMLLSPEFEKCLYKSDDTSNLANLVLREAAGKVVIVLDYDEGIDPAHGFFRFRDGFVERKKVWICGYRGLNMTVCDRYSDTSSYGKMSEDQIGKWNEYAGMGRDYLFLLSWTLTAGAEGSIRELAHTANSNLPGVLSMQSALKKPKPNIVYIDYMNVEIARVIISYNFE